MKSKEMVKLSLYFLALTVVLGSIHFFVLKYFFTNVNFIIDTVSIYTFHLVVSFVIALVITLVSKIDFNKIGFAFMALSVLKMLASILFLLPIIKAKQQGVLQDVINFFIPYFIYLFLEIWFALIFVSSNENTNKV